MKQQQQQSESILYEAKERNKEMTSLQQLYIRCGTLYGLFWLLNLLFQSSVPRYKLGNLCGVVLMVMCTAQLMWNATTAIHKTKGGAGGAVSKLHIVTIGLLVVFGIMSTSMTVWKLLIYVLAIIVYLLYALFLFCAITNRLTLPDDVGRHQDTFFDILILICASITSMVFLEKSSQTTWPSDLSFYCVLASLLWYVHATLLASRMIWPRGTTGDPTMILYTSGAAVSSLNIKYFASTSFEPFMGNLLAASLFVYLWPEEEEVSDNDLYHSWIWKRKVYDVLYFSLFPVILACFELLGYPTMYLTARQFHVRSDASILVETASKSYLYENVVSAELEPRCTKFPHQSETNHVYCPFFTDVRRVVVELTEGRWLHINPEHPTAFVEAVARTVERRQSQAPT